LSAQVDPIEGGTPNNYVYVLDPINGNDYSGLLSVTTYSGMQGWNGAGNFLQPAIVVVQVTIHATRIQNATLRPPVVNKTQAASSINVKTKSGTVRGPMASVKGIEMSKYPLTTTINPSNTYVPKSGGGYFNVGVGYTKIVRGVPIGVNVGVKISLDGAHIYTGTGVSVRPGIGGSLSYSPSTITSGCNFEASGYYGAGLNVSSDLSWEVGVGTPGAFAGTTCTF
jgi:hypothetical protein